MNMKRILIVLTLTMGLLLISIQALASSTPSVDAKKTPHALKTPGAVATQKAEEKGNKLHGKHENYKGTITAVDAASLTLMLKEGNSVTIGLLPETRINVPGLKEATTKDLLAGQTAMVQAIRDQKSNLMARAVVVIPGKPTRVHRAGWVTAYEPGASITILSYDGNTYTFLLTPDIKILPAERAGLLVVGARVTIIAPRETANTTLTAKGIVVHPEGSGAGSYPEATATPSL